MSDWGNNNQRGDSGGTTKKSETTTTTTTTSQDDSGKSKSPVRSSPSAFSIASAALEWDPSADVGVMASGAGLRTYSSVPTGLNCMKEVSNCHYFSGPPFDLEGLQSLNRPRSRTKHTQTPPRQLKLCSTPTLTVTLPRNSLMISPVLPPAGTSDNINRQQLTPKNSQHSSASEPFTITDDETNNDEATVGNVSPPGKYVSEGSTDWEYDQEKRASVQSMPDWLVSGVTRSEIQYFYKKSGSASGSGGTSSSAPASMFFSNVDANPLSKNLNRKNGKENEIPSRKSTSDSSTQSKHSSVVEKITRNKITDGSENSNPSTMCLAVTKFLQQGTDCDPQWRYKVLKEHRDVHMRKAFQELALLEKLNNQLLDCRNVVRLKSSDPRRPSKQDRDLGTEARRLSKHDRDLGPEVRRPSKQDRDLGQEARRPSKHNRDLEPEAQRLLKDICDLGREPRRPSKYKLDLGPLARHILKDSRDLGQEPRRPSKQDRGVGSDACHSSKQDHDVQTENMEPKTTQEFKIPPRPSVTFFVSVPSIKKDNQAGPSIKCASEPIIGTENTALRKAFKEFLKENNPRCYKNVKERDNLVLDRKWTRKVSSESILEDAVEKKLSAEEIEGYLKNHLKKLKKEGKKEEDVDHLGFYYKKYMDLRSLIPAEREKSVISLQEMKERTTKLLCNDYVVQDKKKKEAEERRRAAIRFKQKQFSTNLRRFQIKRGVHIPENMELGEQKLI